ncbi:MAG: dTDP-4-dehydrorhamnose reductase, partial [Maribacter sp.]
SFEKGFITSGVKRFDPMKRILVTGASGQLGLSIQNIHKKYTNLDFVFVNPKELDITDSGKVKEIFGSDHFDYCINCAAYANVEQAEKHPEKAFAINGEGVKNIALACKTNNVVLIHISTDYVFNGEKVEPYTTKDATNPINEYGKSKLLGEQYIQQILKKYYIVRTSWLYSEFGKNFYKTILEKAKTEKLLFVTDQQIGCPTHAINLAKFILEDIILKRTAFGLYHFTDGVAMTWFDFAKKIIADNNLNRTTKVVRDNNYRSFAKRPRYSVLELFICFK